jgi:hypothetical protein
MGVAAAPLLAGLGVLAVLPFLMPEVIPITLVAIAVASLVLFGVWSSNPLPRLSSGVLAADPTGLRLDGAPIADRSHVTDGFVVPRGSESPVVRLRRKGLRLPIEIQVPSRDDGRQLLRVLGLDASQTVASFRLPSRAYATPSMTFWSLGGIAAAFVILANLLGAPGGAVGVFFVIAIATVLLQVPSVLRVGADGLVVSWLGRKRFVSYADVERVTDYEDGFARSRFRGLSFSLRGGAVLRIPIARPRWSVGDKMDLIRERVREAMESHARGDAAVDATLLARDGRSLGDWLAALRGIGTGANATHRVAPVPPERLWRIVEDPGAKPVARATAAVALGAALDDEGRVRLRVAAEAVAAPKLRVALEEVAGEARDEALTKALEELEEEGPQGLSRNSRAPR